MGDYLISRIFHEILLRYCSLLQLSTISGADPGEGGGAPPKIGKNMIFWRKIVIIHTKYPQNVRASLRN